MYYENMTSKFNSNFKNAFTLAEVLIALVIVGVVAALVISPLINTYVETSTVAKVKKGLSILGQAKKLAENQKGPIDGWDFGNSWSETTTLQFWDYIKPYISLAKDCGTRKEACYQSNGTYELSGSVHTQTYNNDSRFYKFVLNDGSVMWFAASIVGKCTSSSGNVDNVCATFYYDVNGNKKPNTFGRDIFIYYMTPVGVYPNLSNNCSKSAYGSGCSGYIIKHNNMKYLH